MLFKEGVNELKGHLSIKVYRCGTLYREEETDNLIVTQGRLNLAKLLSGLKQVCMYLMLESVPVLMRLSAQIRICLK